MSGKMDVQLKKCITPKFRTSFPSVFKPKSFKDQPAKFSITMLFDKATDLKDLRRAATNALIEKFGPDKTNWPKRYHNPFRDGNEKADMDGYADQIFVTASSKSRPGLIDKNKKAILDEADFYPGCYARAEVIAFWFETDMKKGLSFALMNLMKVGDGEPFSGKKSAEEAFESIEVETDGEPDSDDDSFGDSAFGG